MFQFSPVSPRITKLREARNVFASGIKMNINSERTKIYTDYCKTHDNEYPLLKRSGALKTWCLTKETNIFDDDIFAGSLGPDERSLSPYVEWNPVWIPDIVDDTDENFKKAWQSPGTAYMSDEQRAVFREAYDYWKDRSLSMMVKGGLTEDYWDVMNGNGSIVDRLTTYGEGWIASIAQGHYVANFNKAINIGFGAVRRELLERIKAQSGKLFGSSAKSHVFYYSMLRVCDGAIALSKRYAEACRQKAESSSGERREELLCMADSLDWIMENPARTYWEGLQVIILYELMIVTDAQQHGQSLGRVDKYAGHLLEKELAEGTLSLETAQMYTDAFILKLYDMIHMQSGSFRGLSNKELIERLQTGRSLFETYIGSSATAGILLTLGGRKPSGEDDTTPATALFLEAYGRMKLPEPSVALRINNETPDHIWRLGIEASKLCGGMPMFENDNVIVPMLQEAGLSYEDACDYSIVGCVEPAGTGNEWPACGMTGAESMWNMVNIIQLVINGGVNPRTGKTSIPCKKLYEYNSFDEVKAEYDRQLKYILDWNVSYGNHFELIYSHYFPCVSASCMIDGCMESGKDVTEGGAKYNRTGITACGTANVADSLMAIKKLCFDDKTVTLRELYDALQANWAGYEDLRQTIINDVPHYGNGSDEVDELAAWALGRFAEIMAASEGPRGKYSGGTFTMTAHIGMGAVLGATPDGRRAGEPLADAISPRQGFDKNGPTAYLHSAAKLPHNLLSNGDQLNIRFSPATVNGEDGASKLRQLISAYYELGGMQVQFNVVGTKELYEAQKKPAEYEDLVVRIAGFSTYFVTLSTETQDDFISRTEQFI